MCHVAMPTPPAPPLTPPMWVKCEASSSAEIEAEAAAAAAEAAAAAAAAPEPAGGGGGGGGGGRRFDAVAARLRAHGAERRDGAAGGALPAAAHRRLTHAQLRVWQATREVEARGRRPRRGRDRGPPRRARGDERRAFDLALQAPIQSTRAWLRAALQVGLHGRAPRGARTGSVGLSSGGGRRLLEEVGCTPRGPPAGPAPTSSSSREDSVHNFHPRPAAAVSLFFFRDRHVTQHPLDMSGPRARAGRARRPTARARRPTYYTDPSTRRAAARARRPAWAWPVVAAAASAASGRGDAAAARGQAPRRRRRHAQTKRCACACGAVQRRAPRGHVTFRGRRPAPGEPGRRRRVEAQGPGVSEQGRRHGGRRSHGVVACASGSPSTARALLLLCRDRHVTASLRVA